MNINELDNLSDQELDAITKRIYTIRNDRRLTKIKSLIERFKDTWNELENEGVNINYASSDTLELNLIDFDY
jgi:pyruvate formate-lyase activating enzyme-like uncharacterized protein